MKTNSKTGSASRSTTTEQDRPTILGVIWGMFNRREGATQKEMVEACASSFPERDPEGMAKTVRIQCSRMPLEKGFQLAKGTIPGRGYVYRIAEAE